MEERTKEEGSRVLSCLKATCCSDPDSPEGKCKLPTAKRSVKPVSYRKYELLECFPYFFEATWLLDKFPCIKWLVRYNPRWLLADVIAGLAVGLMVVPQALAYATIARLPHIVSCPSAIFNLSSIFASVHPMLNSLMRVWSEKLYENGISLQM